MGSHVTFRTALDQDSGEVQERHIQQPPEGHGIHGVEVLSL